MAISGIATTGSAQRSSFEKFEKNIRQARKVRENSGDSFHVYEKFLEAKNIKTVKTVQRYSFKEDGGGATDQGSFTTQKIDDIDTKGIDIVMSLSWPTYYNPNYYTELYWRYYFKRGTNPESTGERPLDAIGFSWLDSCWEPQSYSLDDTSASSQYVNFEDSAFGANTFGFDVDDYEIAGNTTGSCGGSYTCETYSDYYWGGVYLSSEKGSSGCDLNSDTKILGVYDHTWNGSYSSFGVSAGWPNSIGITYTTNTYVDSESTTTEDNGSDALLVSLDKDHS